MNCKLNGNLIKRACVKVPAFYALLEKFKARISIHERSESTYRNYALQLAKMVIYFNKLPTVLTEDEIYDYLYVLQNQAKTPSQSTFKFMVYSLRFLFKIEGCEGKRILLPKIKNAEKIPVVLNRDELRRLLKAPKLLKHRILIALMYSCGLRCFELQQIKLKDFDFERKQLHIKRAKGNKERIVPLSNLMIKGLKKYIAAELPLNYLFAGLIPETPVFKSKYSIRGIQWIVKQASKKAGILKEVSTHTLRHSYATHLLEDGLNIVMIQKLLGHSHIQTTMIYLHLVNCDQAIPFSPLDNLYR
jgi:integrase